MKTADLVADHRTDALVALARKWELLKQDGLWKDTDGYGRPVDSYSPSTTRAQWAELIEVFEMDIFSRKKSTLVAIWIDDDTQLRFIAKTIGLAICKAVIAAKWGDELPDEIWDLLK